jgi:hypothetical protein
MKESEKNRLNMSTITQKPTKKIVANHGNKTIYQNPSLELYEC